MLLMKACPRCSGDLIRTQDPYDEDAAFTCVQCGYASYRPVLVASAPTASAAKSEYDEVAVSAA